MIGGPLPVHPLSLAAPLMNTLIVSFETTRTRTKDLNGIS